LLPGDGLRVASDVKVHNFTILTAFDHQWVVNETFRVAGPATLGDSPENGVVEVGGELIIDPSFIEPIVTTELPKLRLLDGTKIRGADYWFS
jgi:hypothetical protein